MRALILDGSRKEDKVLEKAHNIIKERLEKDNWEVKSFILRDIQVAPCLGCFGCWIKTPGVCVINDLGRTIGEYASQSDLWIFITPIIFGGYSSCIKKAIDRLAPIFTPIFMKENGEVHHKWRSRKKPYLISMGLSLENNDKAVNIFKKLTNRNSLNFHSPGYVCETLASAQTEESIRMRVDSVIMGMKA